MKETPASSELEAEIKEIVLAELDRIGNARDARIEIPVKDLIDSDGSAEAAGWREIKEALINIDSLWMPLPCGGAWRPVVLRSLPLETAEGLPEAQGTVVLDASKPPQGASERQARETARRNG